MTETKKSTIDEKIQKVVEKFPKEKNQGVFNLAWKLLHDYPERDCAIVAVILGSGNGYSFGIADRGTRGYTPTGAYFPDIQDFNVVRELATWFNTNVLDLTEIQAWEIVTSSMAR